MRTEKIKCTDKEFNEFIDTWEKNISEVKKKPMDTKGTSLIYHDFKVNVNLLMLCMDNSQRDEYFLVLKNLESKLILALESSRSMYKLQSHSIWVRVFESIASTTINRLPSR